MKRCLALLVWIYWTMVPSGARAQALYGQFSASPWTNLVGTNYLYGATAGALIDGPLLFGHMRLSGDVQARFVGTSVERYDGAAVGPRCSVPLRHGIAPYGEFLVGFARYSNRNEGGATTDATVQINAGIAKRISAHWDVTADYSYAQYYALSGEYNPKTYSVGTIFHLVKR
jgi:hypothetical protein